MNPFYLMALLYLGLAGLAALDASLVTLQVLPAFPGQRWLLVHTVTLGALVELVFALTPDLSAGLMGLKRPAFRWDRWFLLNTGLIVLMAGIPLVNPGLIITGGLLIFLAAFLLIGQIGALAAVRADDPARPAHVGLPFYAGAVFYLLVGIVVGTGLWLNWAEPLRIVTPKEVHVHSNLWGFAALALAGLLTDLYPAISGHEVAKPRLVRLTFWLMALGAMGLVIGPWINLNSFTVGGLVLHTVGILLMLFNLARPLRGDRQVWTPGVLHLAGAYVWFLLAVVVAPLVVAGGGAGAEVAGSGGPILIFGWILQAGYALIPFLFERAFGVGARARLGGSAFTLLTINGGSMVYWISMFLAAGRSPMRAMAYVLWIVSLIPILMGLVRQMSARLEALRDLEGARH